MTEAADYEHLEVQRLRSRGDALVRAGRSDEARATYQTALSIVETQLTGHEFSTRPAEKANLLGIQGGLQRRLGQNQDALRSYRQGAEIEAREDLPATYNRVNAIKFALVVNDCRLADLMNALREIRSALEQGITTKAQVTDDAWSWADLGDVLALLGESAAAIDAYRTFSKKARSTSPSVTLDVIKGVADAMRKHGDPDADRVKMAVDAVEQVLRG